MAIQYREDPAYRLAEIEVEGRVTNADFDEVAPRIQALIDSYGTIRLLEVIRGLDGFEPSMTWKGIKFDMRNLRHISHVAVVSDFGWIGPLSKAAGAFMSTRIRTFDLQDLDAARAWLKNP